MSGKSRVVSLADRSTQSISRLKVLKSLSEFDGTPDRFLNELLAVQCRLAGADCGLIMRSGEQDRLEILASYPNLRSGKADLTWMTPAIQAFNNGLVENELLVVPLAGEAADNPSDERQSILIGLQHRESVRTAVVFLVPPLDPQALSACQEQLALTPLLLNHYELQLTLARQQASIDRLGLVLEVMAAINRQAHFKSAAMALCNEMAARLNCSRVSLGFIKGRCVNVQAISHMDSYSRDMQMVQSIEATMEECLDQDVETVHPAPAKALYADRAAAQLSKNHGPAAVLSLPMRHNGDGVAVLTLERSLQQPFHNATEIETARLVCELCTPRLSEMHLQSRWIGHRLARQIDAHAGRLAGPEHTGLKLGAAAVIILALFLTFGRGNHRIEASFVIEAPVQQVVAAPFDTYIRSIAVDPGATVEAGRSVLGELDTSELRLELAALKAQRLAFDKQGAASMRDGKTAEAQIADAQSQQCTAQIRLLEQHIQKATLIAPISGRLVSEDLKRQIGAPVKTGQVLFEIARITALRAELYVAEEEIVDVRVGQQGELVCVGHPERKIRFQVDQIHPMAEVVNEKNVFRVRARLQEQLEWMRPGMEGIAKIQVGKRSYLWLGSHRLTNWLRMQLWF